MAFGKAHPEWAEFEQSLRDAIAQHQLEIENADLDLAGTNFVRGRIAALRKIIDDGTPPEPAIRSPSYA